MKICRYLKESHIFLDLKPGEKVAVLRDFLFRLKEKGVLRNTKTILKKLLERENLCSTGLERGIALPHALTEEVSEPFLALALIKEGVQYGSLDQKPTFILFLILGNRREPGFQLKILAHICRLVKETNFVERVKKVESAREICALLNEVEGKMG